MLAAGAPVMAHWIADRQSGPQILRNGSERAKKMILPEIAAGRCYFAIGMSEPDTGSDLASVRTRAGKVEGGYRVTGRKVWTSYAHEAHYLIALVRTGGRPEERHVGLTQLVVDLKSPGITIRPILNVYGGHDFNEVTFDDVFVPEDMIVGSEGQGWAMVTSELAYERSGPDRFMSTYRLLVEALRELGSDPCASRGRRDGTAHRASGDAAAHVDVHCRAARKGQVAGDRGCRGQGPRHHLRAGDSGGGAQACCRSSRAVMRNGDLYAELQRLAQQQAPSYSLRGGTREILRGMIARGLGLR